MKDIMLSLVLASPLLIIMIYPSMKIVDFISKYKELDQKTDDRLTIVFTIILSLIGGILLHYF